MFFCMVDPTTGLWQGDAILDGHPTLDDGTPDPSYIEKPVPPDAGFTLARWTGEAWVEGGSPPELTTSPPEPTEGERIAALEAQNLDLMDTVAALAEIVIGGGLT